MLEKASTIDSRPRAAHLVGPAIQMFRRAGVLEDVRESGFLPKNWAFRKFDGTPIVTIEDIAASRSPDATTVLPIGKLCGVLLSHAERKSKISLNWSHQVSDIGQDGTAVWAIVQTPEGTKKRFTGDFLCGCDGGTSQVRKSLLGERNFPGKTWDVQFVATDVSQTRSVPHPWLNVCPDLLPVRQIWLRRRECNCSSATKSPRSSPYQGRTMARRLPGRLKHDFPRNSRQPTCPV